MGAAEVVQEVVYTKGVGSLVSGRNPVGNNLHWTKTGYGVILGGAAADI